MAPATPDAALRRQAARLALGKLPPEEMVAAIDRALHEGTYVDAFLPALEPGVERPRDEPRRGFEALLAHRGLVLPDRIGAIWQLVAWHVERIADDGLATRKEMADLIDAIYWEPEIRDTVRVHLGDGFDLQQLIGNHWAFDDLEERPDTVSCAGKFGAEGIAQMERLSRIEARRWLAAHPEWTTGDDPAGAAQTLR